MGKNPSAIENALGLKRPGLNNGTKKPSPKNQLEITISHVKMYM